MGIIKWGLLAFILTMPLEAMAQQRPCGDRDYFIKELLEEYNEVITGRGLEARGSVFELFTSKTGSWTIIVTSPNGSTCNAADGYSWGTFDLLDNTEFENVYPEDRDL